MAGTRMAALIFPNKLTNAMQIESQNLTTKYNIKKRLQTLPGTFTANKYLLCAHLNKTEKTVDKWLNIKVGDQYSITVDDLYLLADFFHCNPTELINR
jgi:hypothetical protein